MVPFVGLFSDHTKCTKSSNTVECRDLSKSLLDHHLIGYVDKLTFGDVIGQKKISEKSSLSVK